MKTLQERDIKKESEAARLILTVLAIISCFLALGALAG